jgi:Ni/Fe-hydrogenase 1 B-type cytochrome subunit
MIEQRMRIYAWEFPVRLTHWINFLCIIVLSVTGFYIGKPFIHAYSTDQYIMGWVRFIHFVAAYAFLMSVLIRLYWSFVGNNHASIKTFFPFTRMGHMSSELKCYLLMDKKPHCYVGHTHLGGLAMLIVYLIFLFMIFSGFALYSVNHNGAIWTILGGWLLGIMNLQTIRLFHHLLMYGILAFAMLHVYIAWFLDVRGKTALMDSIFSGYKYIPEKEME